MVFLWGEGQGAVAPPPSPQTPLPTPFMGAEEDKALGLAFFGFIFSPYKGLGEGVWGRG
jgi:hypothetical protein